MYGVVCLRWKPFSDGVSCDVELVLKANYIEVNNQQAAASLFVKDAQKEFEEFWESYKADPLSGMDFFFQNTAFSCVFIYLFNFNKLFSSLFL